MPYAIPFMSLNGRDNRMQGVSVFRSDGVQGTIVGQDTAGHYIIEFNGGSRMVVQPNLLYPQQDGSYRLWVGNNPSTVSSPASASEAGAEAVEEVLEVIEEDFRVEKQLVDRAKVRVNKRIETRDEVVNTPLVHEEVVVDRIPINQLIEGEVPAIREEGDVLIIPLVEEVVVVEKRLFLREEVRVSKNRKTETNTQTVTLRREIVDVERTELDTTENAAVEPH
jgi:uncharacterized protein (TIGR02271 family)